MLHFLRVAMETISIEVICTVIKEEFRIFETSVAVSDSPFAEEEGKIGMYVVACIELVYTTKCSLIRVSSKVKQL